MNTKKGFTLLEILLVIAAIGILAAIVIVAINPGRQLAQARNAERENEVATISSAVAQYLIDEGSLPAGIPVFDTTATPTPETFDDVAAEIAIASGSTCADDSPAATPAVTDLSPLVDNNYLAAIPTDPSETAAEITANCTGYTIAQNDSGRVFIQAPKAEAVNGTTETIEVVR